MRTIVKIFLMSVIAIQGLTGCAFFKGKKAVIKNQDLAYLASHEGKPLQKPENIPNAAFGDELAIPAAGNQAWNGKPPSLMPPNTLAADIATGKVQPAAQPKKKSWWSRWF